MISLFIKAALEGYAPAIHGDGRQTRDFTYFDNVVNGVLRAAAAPDASGEVINVATGGHIALMDVWTPLCQIMGCTTAPQFGPPRDGDVRNSQADIRKAERLLGCRPSVTFENGLSRTVEWFRTTGG